MLILGIDTSTSAIAVGLTRDDEVVARAARIDARGHAEHLSPLIAEVLQSAGAAPADLEAIAVGNGPGPFTGLRVGLVTALTLGHALGIEVHGICSLDALAAAADIPVGGRVLVATDARRKEVYWALYTNDGGVTTRDGGPRVDRPADLPAEVGGLPTVGRGPGLHPGEFAWGPPMWGRGACDPAGDSDPARDSDPAEEPNPTGGSGPAVLDVDAGILAALVARRLAAGEAMPVTPLYLRRPDALTTAERGHR